MSSESNVQAREASADFQEHIRQMVESDSDISSRLQSLELAADSTMEEQNWEEDSASDITKRPKIRSQNDFHLVEDVDIIPGRVVAQGESSNFHTQRRQAPQPEESFSLVLATTRVYSRVKDAEIDAISSILTTRSRAWSILSGLSLAEISIVSVIKLPLDDSELVRFQRLASLSVMKSPEISSLHRENSLRVILQNPKDNSFKFRAIKPGTLSFEKVYGLSPPEGPTMSGSGLNRIKRELANLQRDPPSTCTVGPVGENLVSGHALHSHLSQNKRLTDYSFCGKG